MRASLVISALVVLLFSSATATRPAADDAGVASFTKKKHHPDQVLYLPGAPSAIKDSLYAGYISVSSHRALFYILAEATEVSAEKAPLVVWLNGGPGCSSIGGGFLSELGPFYPSPGGKTLITNPYAWSRVANVLFIESPANVGFSYSNSSADNTVGDARTASDLLTFLVEFVHQRHPRYKGRDLWITGESYAGHYVPGLASAVLDHNAGHHKHTKSLDLKGVMIGNAWTDAALDNKGALDMWWSHAVISDGTHAGALRTCNLTEVGPLAALSPSVLDPCPRSVDPCNCYLNVAMVESGFPATVNIYDIYADVCVAQKATAAPRQLARLLRTGASSAGVSGSSTLLGALASAPATLLSAGPEFEPEPSPYDPCVDDEVSAYLNRRDVQRALHANISGLLPGPWQVCNAGLDYSRADVLSSMLPTHRKLLAADLSILIFSGDVDAIVPVMSTRNWIRALPLTLRSKWALYFVGTQVGGYREQYLGPDGKARLTFATVRGAGHMAPYTQPARAFHVFNRFLHGKDLV